MGHPSRTACLRQKPSQCPGVPPPPRATWALRQEGYWAVVSQGAPRQGGHFHIPSGSEPGLRPPAVSRATASNFTLDSAVVKCWRPSERHPLPAGRGPLHCASMGPAQPSKAVSANQTRIPGHSSEPPFSAPCVRGPRPPPGAASPALQTVTVHLVPAVGVGTALSPRGPGTGPGKGHKRGTGAVSPGQAHSLRPTRTFREVIAGTLPPPTGNRAASGRTQAVEPGCGPAPDTATCCHQPPLSWPAAQARAPPLLAISDAQRKPGPGTWPGQGTAPGGQGASPPPWLGAASLKTRAALLEGVCRPGAQTSLRQVP